MNKETLERAKFLKEEIQKLDDTIRTYKRERAFKSLRKFGVKYDLKLNVFLYDGYGFGRDFNLNLEEHIKDKILDILQEYKNELENEFSKL